MQKFVKNEIFEIISLKIVTMVYFLVLYLSHQNLKL